MADYVATYLPLPAGQSIVAVRGTNPAGHRSLPHRHPEGQLLGSVRGLLTVGTEQGVGVVPAIHAVWMPPHCVHWARSHGAMDGWTVYVDEPACTNLPSQPCTIRSSALLREAVFRAASWLPGERTAADERVAGVILDEIGSLPSESFGLPLPCDPRLLRVATALIDDPSDQRGVTYWASVAAVSERTLGRGFLAETGFHFSAWRQRARLLKALEMLADQRPVVTIALDLGYATASAFIALFRRVLGETPASYRARLMGV